MWEIKSPKGKKRYGEILLILDDNPGDPTIECAEVDPKELTPIEDAFGNLRTFKSRRSNLKHYVPRKNLFQKETFDVGKCVACKSGSRIRYGRIMGYLKKKDYTIPTTKVNTMDTIYCKVQIDPRWIT